MKDRFLILLIIFIFSSCKTNLKQEEIKWNPYKKGEILVFTSNMGENDTIFILDVTNELHPTRHGTELPVFTYNQNIEILVKHTDPNYDRYLISNFFELEARTKDSPTTIRFLLAAKNSWLYGGSYKLEKLKEKEQVKLKVPFGEFNDVLIIEDTEEEYAHRTNYVKKIYWSRSEGYVKWEKLDGTTWELKNKYVP